MALSGRAGSGKSEVAKVFVENGYTLVKFADPLKNMLRALYKSCGLTDKVLVENRIEGFMKEEGDHILCGKSPRHAMQTIGTEWGRNMIHPNLWTSIWSRKAASVEGPVVVDDCRFLNEAQTVSAMGGLLVFVDRGDAKNVGNHISETFEGIVFDGHLVNGGTLEDLKEASKNFL